MLLLRVEFGGGWVCSVSEDRFRIAVVVLLAAVLLLQGLLMARLVWPAPVLVEVVGAVEGVDGLEVEVVGTVETEAATEPGRTRPALSELLGTDSVAREALEGSSTGVPWVPVAAIAVVVVAGGALAFRLMTS